MCVAILLGLGHTAIEQLCQMSNSVKYLTAILWRVDCNADTLKYWIVQA